MRRPEQVCLKPLSHDAMHCGGKYLEVPQSTYKYLKCKYLEVPKSCNALQSSGNVQCSEIDTKQQRGTFLNATSTAVEIVPSEQCF